MLVVDIFLVCSHKPRKASVSWADIECHQMALIPPIKTVILRVFFLENEEKATQPNHAVKRDQKG